MDNGKNRYYTINGGISLILLTFVILSLVSFAALSVTTAQADLRLADRYEAQADAYYHAHNEAQKFLVSLRSAAEAGSSDSADDSSTVGALPASAADPPDTGAASRLDLLSAVLPEGCRLDADAGTIIARFSAGETQDLILVVDAATLEVVTEKTESTVDYSYDSSLPVLR